MTQFMAKIMTMGEQVRRVRRFFSVSEELLLSVSVLFLPILYMMAALASLSGVGLGRWVFPVGLLLWGVAVVALHRREGWQRLAATLLLFLAVFALVAFLTSLTLDLGFDSRLYHLQAIVAFLKEINPYWHPDHWLFYSYPAAHWLLSASLIAWTQSFEASFTFTVVAAFASFLCVRRFLETMPNLSRRWRNLLAALLAVNPIATGCFFTHYTDGLFASTLLSVFMLMLCFVCDKGYQTEDKWRRLLTAFWIAATLVLLVNTKFTGLVFGGILGVTALAYGVRRGVSRRTFLQLAGLGSGAAILGVVVFGFFPYATNVAQGKHPFYPAIKFDEKGVESDVVGIFFDREFYNRSSYEKWWISLFSKNGKSWNVSAPLPPFSSLDVQSFQHGFGSFFSGALLLCLTLVFFVRHRGAWVVLAGVMLSVLSTRASFEFRLTPQSWWLPLLSLVFLLAPDDRKSFLSRAQTAVVFFVTACLLYVSVQRFRHYGQRAINAGSTVRLLEEQGGWFVVPDLNVREAPLNIRRDFFNYYKSGLSGVRLPTLERCPDKAERRTPIYGLMLCKPNP